MSEKSVIPGDELRRLRDKLRISQREAAALLDVVPARLVEMEEGRRAVSGRVARRVAAWTSDLRRGERAMLCPVPECPAGTLMRE